MSGLALRNFLIEQISKNGPMHMGHFISHVLCHPQYGYYTRKDPLGVMGDFTTAPEISQMFGELVGAWAADCWEKMGRPDPFILLEGGPGRGTLMADALRATKGAEEFHAALEVHFLENSPTLRKVQAKAVKGFKPVWHDTLDSVPQDKPVIMIANELLDALPIRQFEKTPDGWAERVVMLAESTEALADEAGGLKGVLAKTLPNVFADEEVAPFIFGRVALPKALEAAIPARHKDAPPGSICEFSATRDDFVRAVCAMLKAQSGVALFIDYGHEHPKPRDTIRAIYNHRHIEILSQVGEADLSANVNFGQVAAIARECGVSVTGPGGQGAFLESLGIQMRAEILKKSADEKQAKDIQDGMERLVLPERMGVDFQVIALSDDETIELAGFPG